MAINYVNQIDLDLKIPPLADYNSARILGGRCNEPITVYKYQSLIPAAKCITKNLSNVRKDLFSTNLIKVLNETGIPNTYYNTYGQIIDDNLHHVAPIFMGKFKNAFTLFTSSKSETVNDWLVFQFSDGCKYIILQSNLIDIYIGALPSFKIKQFKQFTSISWQFLKLLMGCGYRTDLRSMVETICSLDLEISKESFEWIKKQ